MTSRTTAASLVIGASLLVGSGLPAQIALPNKTASAPRVPVAAATTPPGNDTSGYWGQRADYTIIATLDERMQGVRATGTLKYVNRSPDALRELYIHQHLNAFRPGSQWSATDEREGRVRFQRLADPAYGYERFTAPPRINGAVVIPEYPLAPDSTVVRLPLSQALRAGDSLTVAFAWEARPSTTARRQGRRERSYDFAQWYPKVAVYDRGGWQPNALVPAGEFYGEFGTFDVTLVLPNDQVVGATGVPVSGDPGWARVAAPGSAPPRLAAGAYGSLPPAPAVTPGNGFRAVRFFARDVHHFAWSASPGFRYEGATYVRPARQDGLRFRTWDTVSVHALYRADATHDCNVAFDSVAADAARFQTLVSGCVNASLTQWQNGQALGYGRETLRWLEALYGDYGYPQLTMVKRIDGGGTEFPMMMQNGSASQGLTLHEGGHIYTYGMLADNEWQSGWMDEGLTSYQTALHDGNVRVIVAARLAARNDRDPANSTDTLLARQRRGLETTTARQDSAVRPGVAEPIGTRGDLFATFAVYNESVYNRAASMYGALHDVLGEELFQAFLRDYYARWAFRHVDRWAMQGSAERVSRRDLGWFFDQWVNGVGAIDYSMRAPVVRREPGGYTTTVALSREGKLRHPMPVGVRTASGWTVARAEPTIDFQNVSITTAEPPTAVWLDPFGSVGSSTTRFYRLTLPAR